MYAHHGTLPMDLISLCPPFPSFSPPCRPRAINLCRQAESQATNVPHTCWLLPDSPTTPPPTFCYAPSSHHRTRTHPPTPFPSIPHLPIPHSPFPTSPLKTTCRSHTYAGIRALDVAFIFVGNRSAFLGRRIVSPSELLGGRGACLPLVADCCRARVIA